jgi:hypothetical protein
MKRIIWCCVPVSIFSVLLAHTVRFAVDTWKFANHLNATMPPQYQDHVLQWAGVWVSFLSFGFLSIWVARLSLAVYEWRTR